MNVAESDRLILRHFTVDDAPFVLTLVNDPAWIRFIGDRGVRDLETARSYLLNGPMAMYERNGFGLYLIVRKEDQAPLGMCGLIKRDMLPDVDLGFALLPVYYNQGYAGEAARAALALGRDQFDLKRIVAITSLDNENSIRLLERLGFSFEKIIEFNAGDPVRLFGIAL